MAHLDAGLMGKLVTKTGKPLKYVREQISKRAGRQGISSEAALILWAKEHDIGTSTYQRGLEPHIQEQVRAGLPAVFSSPRSATKGNGEQHNEVEPKAVSPVRAAIDYLLSDEELKRRCMVMLTARRDFDRAFREATTVLDDRLKKLAKIKGKVNPDALVAQVLHPDRAILVVSEHEDEQTGFFHLIKGLMLAFRNPAHHSLDDKLTREDALRFCGFVDALLTILGKARVNLPTTPKGGSA